MLCQEKFPDSDPLETGGSDGAVKLNSRLNITAFVSAGAVSRSKALLHIWNGETF